MRANSFLESKRIAGIITIFSVAFFIGVNGIVGQTNNIVNPSTDLLYYNYAKDNSINFKTIVDNANDYFREYHLLNGPDIPKIEKQYKRWEYFWRNKLNFQNPSLMSSFKTHESFVNKTQGINGVPCSSSAGNLWTSLGPNTMATSEQGIIQSIAANPNNEAILYAGSYTSGLFKSIDGGASWQNKTDYLNNPSMGIMSIAIDKQNPNNMLFATGNGYEHGFSKFAYGIWRSNDGGDSWTQVLNNIGQIFGLNIEYIKYDDVNPSIVYAVGNNNVYKSTDGGLNWGDIASGYTNWAPISTISSYPSNALPQFCDIEIDNINRNIIYVSSRYYNHQAELWVSMDAGITWADRTPAIPGGTAIGEKISIDVSNADIMPVNNANVSVLYAAADAGGSVYVLKSNDNGLTWQSSGPGANPMQFSYWNGEIEVSNLSNSTTYLSGSSTYKSTNNGAYYPISLYSGAAGVPPVFTHADVRHLKIYEPNGVQPSDDVLFMGTDGGVMKTDNGGGTWQHLNGNGLAITQFYGFDDMPLTNLTTGTSIGSKINGGTQDNGTLRMDNAGIWTHTAGGDGAWTITDDISPNIIYGAGNGGLMKSTDYGVTYGGALGNPTPDGSWNLWMKTYLDPYDHTKFYFLRDKLYIHNGTSWSSKVVKANIKQNATAIAIAPCNNKIMYVAYDMPAAWDISEHPVNGGPTFVSKNKLFKSTDGGVTFIDISGNPGINTMLYWFVTTDIIIDPNNPNHLYCSFNGYHASGSNPNYGEYRIVESTDGGATFNDISDNLPPYPVATLEYQKGTNGIIFAGTDIGVYRYNPANAAGQKWECFNNGMPSAPVTNIEINYCTNKIMASTFGRGIWESNLIVATAPLNICGNLDNVCPSTPVTLSVSGGVNYTWSGGQTAQSIIVTPNVTTSYNVTANNICGTTTTQNITVNVSNVVAPVLNITASNISVCSETGVTLSANGGVGTYTWQPSGMIGNPITVNQNATTAYTVYANGAGGGCVGTKDITINTLPKPTISITSSKNAYCTNDLIPVILTANGSGATAPYSYLWQPNSIAINPISVQPTENTTYLVTVTDANGCVNNTQKEILYSTLINNITSSPGFCSGPNADASAMANPSGGTAPYIYNWISDNPVFTPKTTKTISNLPIGNYQVTVSDVSGCQITTPISIVDPVVTHDIAYDTQITGTNDIWNLATGSTIFRVEGLVTVKSGAKLTIPNGVKVEFSYFKPHHNYNGTSPYGFARLVVEPGGVLVVEPTATVTGCSNGMWEGIELWGVGNTGEPYPNTIYSQIDGYIIGAEIGVLTTKRILTNERPLQANGGHFNSNGAHFFNNRAGVELTISSDAFNYNIQNSEFKVDGTTRYKTGIVYPSYIPPVHISAVLNVNLNVTGSTFVAAGVATFASTGIKCNDCILSANNNTFYQLFKGIDANYALGYSLNMTYNSFSFNVFGLYMQGSYLSSINNNTFLIDNPPGSNPNSYGMQVIGASGFEVKENVFNKYSFSDPDKPAQPASFLTTYAMAFENITTSGMVFKNIVHQEIAYGLHAQKDNSGLTIRCNTFEDPVVASIYVPTISGFTTLLKDQGRYDLITGFKDCTSPNYPAGNEWNYSTGTCSGTQNIATSTGVSFKYESHDVANTKPTCSPSAWYNVGALGNVCIGVFKTSTSCDDAIPQLPHPPPLTGYTPYYNAIKNLLNNYLLQIQQLKGQYKQALANQDAGNTQNLLNLINSAGKSAGQLKNTLTNSGALSDAVLIAAINKQPPLPPGVLKDILFNQAPLSLDVLNALDGINLPNGINQNIITAQNNAPLYVTARALLSSINYLQSEVYLLEAEFLRTRLKETQKLDKAFLTAYSDANTKEMLAQQYVIESKPDSLRQVITQLQSDSTLTSAEKQNTVSFFNTMATVLDNHQNLYSADSTLISILPIIEGNKPTKASVHANAALRARNRHHYDYSPELIVNAPTANARLLSASEEEVETSINANTGNFVVYPNPNNGDFKIQLSESIDSETEVTICIADILGKVVYSQTVAKTPIIEVKQNLLNGMYIINLIQNEKTVGISKLIIK